MYATFSKAESFESNTIGIREYATNTKEMQKNVLPSLKTFHNSSRSKWENRDTIPDP